MPGPQHLGVQTAGSCHAGAGTGPRPPGSSECSYLPAIPPASPFVTDLCWTRTRLFSWNVWPARPRDALVSMSPVLGLQAQVITAPPFKDSCLCLFQCDVHENLRASDLLEVGSQVAVSCCPACSGNTALLSRSSEPSRRARLGTALLPMLAWCTLCQPGPQLRKLSRAGPRDAIGSSYSSYRRSWNHLLSPSLRPHPRSLILQPRLGLTDPSCSTPHTHPPHPILLLKVFLQN